LKVFKEVAEHMASGRLFHTRAAATPSVHVEGILSAERIAMFRWSLLIIVIIIIIIISISVIITMQSKV